MTSALDALRSSIGAKLVMAVTGIVLLLFVIGHLLGNLQVFLGPEALNHYARKLHSVPRLLWILRLGLIACVLLHILAAIRVAILNRTARPQRYVKLRAQAASWTARTLQLSGGAIALYVVYHLMHFTFRNVHTQYVHEVEGHVDVYTMVVGSFQQPGIALVYTLSMVLLGMHLSHGIGGFLQTLGLGHPRYSKNLRWLGPVLATLLTLGYISIPVAVLLGLVAPPAGGGP